MGILFLLDSKSLGGQLLAFTKILEPKARIIADIGGREYIKAAITVKAYITLSLTAHEEI